MGAKKKKTMDEKGPKLLIVESPAKIKTISKFLGKEFKIMSTVGHIKDLPTRKLGISRNDKTKSIDIEYVVMKDKANVIADICKQASKCSEIFLASDPDREGEIIAWHIGQEIEKVFSNPDKIHRIVYNEITKPAITEAIEHKSTVDLNKVAAQQARRILDRWVGYEVSPILWKKIAKGLSAGRVQSIALLLICQRDAEILAFKPEESWSIHGIFLFTSKAEVVAELVKINNKTAKIATQAEAEKIVAQLPKQQYTISKIAEKKRAKNPPAPFMTSTLQQDAFNKLNFPIDRTMSIAQKLYEGVPLSDKNNPEALITYMRTDSLRISDTAMAAVRGFIKKEYGDKYLPKSSNLYGKSGAQDAHEAIRPIDVTLLPSTVARYVTPEQAKLYDLIWKRFVASQMESAEYFQRQVTIDGGPYQFRATGSTLMFDGFLKVYLVEDEENEQAVKIPKDIKEQDVTSLKKIDHKQHFTQPPPRYSEATIIKELEKRGIGRPSTFVAIISTIQKRGYVDKDNKRFTPTELGKAVNEMLVKNLPDIMDISFTAKMEEDLDKIAQGEEKRDVVLNIFYDKFKKDLENFGGKEVSKKSVPTDLDCPLCKNPLVIRMSRSGEFVGCSKFPECKFTSNFTRDGAGTITLGAKEASGSANSGNGSSAPSGPALNCPNCGKQLVSKMGRFGPFMSCPGYPECKYIHQEKLSMPCPKCGGQVAKRRWKGGSFWGCTSYPTCKFAIFGAIQQTPCPKCALPYLLLVKDKMGNEIPTCSDKACGYKEK